MLLCVVFVCATVLIIYYKQVCEGYEDQARFDIMQKVGMTRREIRRSVNSQLLTVFFLPLLGAGLHLAFAFPMLRRLLMLFELQNVALFAWASVVTLRSSRCFIPSSTALPPPRITASSAIRNDTGMQRLKTLVPLKSAPTSAETGIRV